MKIYIRHGIYTIYERVEDGRLGNARFLNRNGNPKFELEHDAVEFIENYGIESATYVVHRG